jgi:hypothetical protein
MSHTSTSVVSINAAIEAAFGDGVALLVRL